MPNARLALLTVLLLTGCATAAQATPPTPVKIDYPVTIPTPIRFAVAGDSITAWDNNSFPNATSDAALFSPVTWTHWAILDGHVMAGGYARSGAVTTKIAGWMTPVDADVLVVQAGTNDIGVVPPNVTLENISTIVSTAGVEKVIVCALPPSNNYPLQVAALNMDLRELTTDHTWSWLDPWAQVRDEGRWVEGFNSDPIHPNSAAAELAAGVIVAEMGDLIAPANS